METRQANEQGKQMSESFRVGALLACAGGFLDAYTFLCRGGVFANAQTGNLALLGIRLANGDWAGACGYLLPVLAFVAGILLAEALRRAAWRGGALHWRQPLLLIESATLLLCVLCPTLHDATVNMAISFVCALQVQGFRKIHGSPIATTMCTGNLRSGTENLFHWLSRREPKAPPKMKVYYGLILCFILGAVVSGLLSPLLAQRTVLLACIPLLTVFALLRRGGAEAAA